jgi:alkylated DNA repair dioxygenase AlkB
MITIFESKGAKLRAGKLDATGLELLESAVQEVENKLIKTPEFALYGKVCMMRRSVGFFADPNETVGYFFSGQLAASQPPQEAVSKLLTSVNETFNSNYNGVLVNKYADGGDYTSAHSDDERALSKDGGVVILSYGTTSRTMRFRAKAPSHETPCAFKGGKFDFEMESGSVLVMEGPNFQKCYTHEVPKQTTRTGTRYSFTFRHHDRKLEQGLLERATNGREALAAIKKRVAVAIADPAADAADAEGKESDTKRAKM